VPGTGTSLKHLTFLSRVITDGNDHHFPALYIFFDLTVIIIKDYNMLNKLFASAALALGLISTLAVSAQAGEVQNRLNNQQARIHQGVASGQLTRGEARRDERNVRSVARERNRMVARNGGTLTRRDKAVLNHRLNRTSTRVYKTKHNAAHRADASTLR
jgi:hypothetical protein